MRDNFKPIPLDDIGFLKNFRGEVTIELKDVETGEVETIHDHNLVTKALSYFLKQGGMTNPSAFNASSVRSDFLTYMLGGMMCLDTAITDEGGHDDEIVRVPAGVKMVANGAVGVVNNSSPTEFGSYNSNESGWQQDGSFKMVWDYTTSQANGTIACVCLTSYFGGYAGIGNRTSLGTKSGNIDIATYNSTWAKGYSGTYIGYKDNRIYGLEAFNGVSEWTVKEYAYPMTATDVRDNLAGRETDSFTVQIPASIQNLQPVYESGGYRPWQVWGSYQSGDLFYLMISATYDNRSSVGLVKVIIYDIANKTVTAVKEYDFGLSQHIFVKKLGISDKWILFGDTLTDLANSANVIEPTKNANVQEVFRAESSDIFYSSSSRVDAVAEEENPINSNTNISVVGAMANNPLLYYAGAQIHRYPRYIATIFNLDSPKTKSADKTMKVSYVLRFDEEGE